MKLRKISEPLVGLCDAGRNDVGAILIVNDRRSPSVVDCGDRREGRSEINPDEGQMFLLAALYKDADFGRANHVVAGIRQLDSEPWL